MALCKRIASMAKKTAIGLAAAAGLAAGAGGAGAQDASNGMLPRAEAEPAGRMPPRKLFLDAASPIESAEANSSLWYSTHQLLGKGLDLLAMEAGTDASLLGRAATTGFCYFSAKMLEVASHELGHVRSGRKDGNDYNMEFHLDSLANFGNNFTKTYGDGNLTYGDSDFPTEERYLREGVAGLNQDELNAYAIHKNMQEGLAFDTALAFLATKLKGAMYAAHGAGPQDVVLPWHADSQIDFVFDEEDMRRYLTVLNENGISQSTNDQLRQELVADLLSFPLWESIRAVANYVLAGERWTKPLMPAIGSTKILPPIISHYLTSDGGFYNATAMVRFPKGDSLEASVGTDADRITGDGRLDHWRFGLAYNGLRVSNNSISFCLSPFIYLNAGKSFKYNGTSWGAEVSLGIIDTIFLRARLEYNNNDILENRVKEEKDGFNALAGLEVRL